MDTTTLQSLMLLTLVIGVGGLVVYQVRVGHTDHILATLMTGAGLTVLIDLPLAAHQPKQYPAQQLVEAGRTLSEHVDFQTDKLDQAKRKTFLKIKEKKPVKIIRLTSGVTFVMVNVQVDRDQVDSAKLEKIARAKAFVKKYPDGDVRREAMANVRESLTKYHKEAKADIREKVAVLETKTTITAAELPTPTEKPVDSDNEHRSTDPALDQSALH